MGARATLGGLAVSVLFCAGEASATAADDTEAQLAPYRPEISATAQLMYDVGACERHIQKADVDRYVRDYMAAPVDAPETIAGYFRGQMQATYTKMYSLGRDDAARLGLSAQECRQAIRVHVDEVLAKRASRMKASAAR